MKNMSMSIQVFRKLMHRYFHDEEAVILALLIVTSAITLYFFGNILAPILAAFIIAYVLTPLVDKLIALKVSYALANALVYMLFLGFLMLFILVLAPLIVKQTTNFLSEAPNMIRDVIIMLQYLPLKYPDLFSEAMVKNWTDYITSSSAGEAVASWAGQLIQVSVQSVPNILAVAVYFVIVPVLVFFVMKDRRLLKSQLESMLPKRRSLLNQIGNEMNEQIANYIRGKVLEIFIVGITAFVLFSFLGLKYTALLAVIIGLSVLVPYVGAISVTLPVFLVALFQWGIGSEVIYVLIAYMILQILDGNVLVPMIFSEAVNLSATAIVVAVLFFGGLWGFWGVFFAIPLATLFKAIINAWPKHPELDGTENE